MLGLPRFALVWLAAIGSVCAAGEPPLKLTHAFIVVKTGEGEDGSGKGRVPDRAHGQPARWSGDGVDHG